MGKRIVIEGTVYGPVLDSLRIAIRTDDGEFAYVEHLLSEGDRVRVIIEPAVAGADTERTAVPHPEHYCVRCGGENPDWTAPSPLWNEVMRGGDINGPERYGVVCPRCFAILAEEAGIARDWRLTAATVTADLQIVTPSGRVWNEQTWLFEDGERPVGTGPTAAEHAETARQALEKLVAGYPDTAFRMEHARAYRDVGDALAALVALADRYEKALERLENATRILDVMLREPAAEGLMSAEDYRGYVQGAWLGVDEAAKAARDVLAGGAGDE